MLTGLNAEQLFEEVIIRDHTFGSLLQEIKAAYDSFLSDHGVSIPEDAVGIVGPGAGASSAARSSAPIRPPVTPPEIRARPPSEHSEHAIDRARRRWMIELEEDLTVRRDDSKESSELERENAALRRLVKRLRVDLAAENGSAAKVPAAKAPPAQASSQKAPKPLRRPDASWTPMPFKVSGLVRHAAATPAVSSSAPARPPSVGVPQAAEALPRLLPPVGDGDVSTRSDSASTVTAGGSICEVPNPSPWSETKVKLREAARPTTVPPVDLSRISGFVDDDSQEAEGEEEGEEEAAERTLTPDALAEAQEEAYAGSAQKT